MRPERAKPPTSRERRLHAMSEMADRVRGGATKGARHYPKGDRRGTKDRGDEHDYRP